MEKINFVIVSSLYKPEPSLVDAETGIFLDTLIYELL